jgi:hypothetical protein
MVFKQVCLHEAKTLLSLPGASSCLWLGASKDSESQRLMHHLRNGVHLIMVPMQVFSIAGT